MKSNVLQYRPSQADNHRLANLCGAVDQNLRQIEEAYDVRIARRADTFSVEGQSQQARGAVRALEHFHRLAADPLTIDDIQLGLVELRAVRVANEARLPDAPAATVGEPVLHTRRTDLQGRTPRQKEYLRNILAHDITFGIGPAGTGKTYLAVACAVDALERDAIKRIVLDAPGGRSRRAPRLPARRPGAEGRPVPSAALRRAVRPDGLRQASARCSSAGRSRSPRSPSCAGAR